MTDNCYQRREILILSQNIIPLFLEHLFPQTQRSTHASLAAHHPEHQVGGEVWKRQRAWFLPAPPAPARSWLRGKPRSGSSKREGRFRLTNRFCPHLGSSKETAAPEWEHVQKVVVLSWDEGLVGNTQSWLVFRSESCFHRVKFPLLCGVRSSEGIVFSVWVSPCV